MADPVVTLDTQRVSIQPGGQAQVTAKIASTSDIVDGYRLEVLGAEPHRWSEVLPPTVEVYPGTEATAVIVFSPPSGTAAPSGVFGFGLLATSTEDPSSSAAAEGEIELGQVFGLQAKIIPVTSSGRWRGRHVIQFSNWGNSAANLQLMANDPDAKLGFYLRPDVVELPVGASATVRMSVRARRPFLRGTPVRLPFQVIGERAGLAAGPTPQNPYGDPSRPVVDGALNQKPILSKMFVTLMALLLIAGVAGGVWLYRQPTAAEGTLAGLGAPSKPENFTATGVAPDKVSLGWDPIDQVSGYRVQKMDPLRKDIVIDERTLSSSQNGLTMEAEGPEKQNCFRVLAFRDTSLGPSSDLKCVMTLKGPQTASPSTTGSPSSTPPQSSAPPSPTETPPTTPSDGTSPSPSPSQTPTATPSPTPSGTETPIPAGKWILVANYYPQNATPKTVADKQAARLMDAGLTALVLDTKDYPKLEINRGVPVVAPLWVVAVGPYDSQALAMVDCDRVSQVPNTVTFCTPRQTDPQ